MEIEIGEYVRTTNGNIAQLTDFFEDEDVKDGMRFNNYIYDKYSYIRYSFLKRIIVKHSKNIIDLIEIGDLVNGYEVIKIDLESEVDRQIIVSTPTVKELHLLNEDIKSIVTHKQFENIEYKIKEKENV